MSNHFKEFERQIKIEKNEINELKGEIERLREENSALLDDFENVQEDRNVLEKENNKMRSIINGIEDQKVLIQLISELTNALGKFPHQTYLEKQLIQRARDVTK